MDLDHLKSWIGKTETLHDQVTLAPLQALAATLDRHDARRRSPATSRRALLAMALFLAAASTQRPLGPDGHPKRGGFLPPVPLPRRMWAGSRLEFGQSLRLCEASPATRTSRIVDVSAKKGRTGSLVFVASGMKTSTVFGRAWPSSKIRTSCTATRRSRAKRPQHPEGCEDEQFQPPRHCGSCAAFPLLGADLQRASYPLRPDLRDWR